MKYLLSATLIVALFAACTKDRKQTDWKVEVTADNPFYSANVRADMKGSDEYNEGTGESYNQTTWTKEFRASKYNEIKVSTISYAPGSMTIKIYHKNKLEKEQTFQNETNGDFSQHSLSYSSK